MALFDQSASASIQQIPSCRMLIRRACRGCGAANPTGLAVCTCGTRFPVPEYRDADDITWGFPLSLFFGTAAALRRAAAWLKRNRP